MKALEDISKGIEYAKKNLGYTLVSEDWGNEEEKCTCALGCLLLSNNLKLGSKNEDSAADLLKVNDKWITAFISGFDETPWNLKHSLTEDQKDNMSDKEKKSLEEAYAGGKTLRNKFKPCPYDQFTDKK